MMITSLLLVDNKLCLLDDNSNEVITKHKPLSKPLEFRKVKDNCIIVRVDPDSLHPGTSNIYCLDNMLKVKWFSEQPFEQDLFPNPILWDKEINDKADTWEHSLKDNIDTLTCSSSKGFTVSINYDTGRITKSVFTK
jgi:hypothetical protein